MSLIRDWYPTGNYTAGKQASRLLVLHTTEGFTGPNGMYDCAIYFQGPVGASSHVIIDNYHPGRIVAGVDRKNSSWTQCGYNGQTAASVEQCGYAAWSRDTWLNDKRALLENTAAWLAEESAHFGIPLVKLTPAQAQGSGRGVCYHSDLGQTGCGHSDPGAGYPIDMVLQWAAAGAPSPTPKPPPTEDDDAMPYVTVPPLGGAPAVPVEISLDGMFSTLGLCTDASVNPSSTGMRVAFHTGPHAWHVANVWSDNNGDNGHEKVVYKPPAKFDGVRIDRIDDNDTTLVVNFGR